MCLEGLELEGAVDARGPPPLAALHDEMLGGAARSARLKVPMRALSISVPPF